MTFNGKCWMRRLAGLAIATSSLTACATAGSERRVVAICPPVVEYTSAFQSQAAEELSLLSEYSATVRMISDYAVMREQARACQ